MAPDTLISGVRRRLQLPRYTAEELVELVTDDGVRLSAARLDGPPTARLGVVLVHGLALSSRTARIHAFARRLAERVSVLVPDLRGHGSSDGLCTLTVEEARDVDAAVAAMPPGLPVVTIGISLGGAAVLLHAGSWRARQEGRHLLGAVAMSAPGWPAWDTPTTSRIRRWVENPAGRALMARALRTRVADACEPVCDAAEVVAAIRPSFTLVVHDPADHFFGEEHAQTIYRWANEPRDLWLLPGAGHGGNLLEAALADRILDHAEAHLDAMGEAPVDFAHQRSSMLKCP